MHKYFFTTKDTFINSGSNQTTGEDFKDKNTGQDEILELKKVFFDILENKRLYSYVSHASNIRKYLHQNYQIPDILKNHP